MSIQSRVVDAVEIWCGKRPDELATVLKDLWDDTAPGSSHSALDFDPDGIEDLVLKLHSEFANPPKRRVTATAADFRGGAKIQTLQKLVDEAVTFPLDAAGFTESVGAPLPAPRALRKRPA